MILSIIVIVRAGVKMHKCRMSYVRNILYDFLENGFCGHSTFVQQTIDVQGQCNYVRSSVSVPWTWPCVATLR